MKKESIIVAILLFTVLVASRLVPHPANFSPLWAVALFCGSYWRGSQFRFVIPLAAMFVTDLYMGMYVGAMITYAAVILAVLVSPALLASAWSIISRSILAATIFFVISNAAVWWFDGLYPHTSDGLMTCFKMGLPFFRVNVESTLLFSGLFYGLYRLVLAPVGFEGFFKLNYGRHQR